MMEVNESIYAKSRVVDDIKDCYFYQTVELPGYGVINGEWDLRDGVDEYLGFVTLKGKRVLEMGTANGFLCFEMEKRGANVVGYDLSEKENWDIVPFTGSITEDQVQNRRKIIRGINNAWWFTHRLLGSKAHVVYGTVYNIPKEIGVVDIVTFGSILLHLRDPFLALQNAAALARESIIVTDWQRNIPKALYSPIIPGFIRKKFINPILYAPLFLPDPTKQNSWDTWWFFTPDIIVRFLKILGYSQTKVTFHKQWFAEAKQPVNLFTVVGTKAKS
jgi:SAM-dependent methyltransferase